MILYQKRVEICGISTGNIKTIKEKGYLIWVAQYGYPVNSLLEENPDLEENMKMWQFTTNNNTLDQSTMYNV